MIINILLSAFLFVSIFIEQKVESCNKSLFYFTVPNCTESNKGYMQDLVNKIIYKEKQNCSVDLVGVLLNKNGERIDLNVTDSMLSSFIEFDVIIMDNKSYYLNYFEIKNKVNKYPSIVLVNNKSVNRILSGTQEIFRYAHK